MAVLLDTHAFLWWCQDAPELSRKARKTISDQACVVSVATFWEISIKVSLGKLRLPGLIDRYLSDQMSLNGFQQLEIGFRHVMRCSSLAWHHRDPFDRLLIAQAQEEKLAIVSRNPALDAYSVKRVW